MITEDYILENIDFFNLKIEFLVFILLRDQLRDYIAGENKLVVSYANKTNEEILSIIFSHGHKDKVSWTGSCQFFNVPFQVKSNNFTDKLNGVTGKKLGKKIIKNVIINISNMWSIDEKVSFEIVLKGDLNKIELDLEKIERNKTKYFDKRFLLKEKLMDKLSMAQEKKKKFKI